MAPRARNPSPRALATLTPQSTCREPRPGAKLARGVRAGSLRAPEPRAREKIRDRKEKKVSMGQQNTFIHTSNICTLGLGLIQGPNAHPAATTEHFVLPQLQLLPLKKCPYEISAKEVRIFCSSVCPPFSQSNSLQGMMNDSGYFSIFFFQSNETMETRDSNDGVARGHEVEEYGETSDYVRVPRR